MSEDLGVDLDAPEDDVEMGFFEHLGELRNRLLYSIYALIPTVSLAFYFRVELLEFLKRPLTKAFEAQGLPPKLHVLSPTEGFIAYLKISLVVGILLAAPVIFYQVWAFIAPGLYRREKRMAAPFITAAGFFFAGGAAFGYEVVFPYVFEFLVEFNQGLESTITISEYVTFSTRMLLAFGIVFEVPVITTLLSFLGIVNWKQLLDFGRWWVLVAAILSAFLTPPDPMSQIMMLVPLVILYFLSVGVAFLINRNPDEPDTLD